MWHYLLEVAGRLAFLQPHCSYYTSFVLDSTFLPNVTECKGTEAEVLVDNAFIAYADGTKLYQWVKMVNSIIIILHHTQHKSLCCVWQQLCKYPK